MQAVVGAADDGEGDFRAHLTGDLPGQPLHGAAAHAAAHHYQVLARFRDAHNFFCGSHRLGGIEHLTHRQAAGDDLLRADAGAFKVGGQGSIRDKVQVQGGVVDAGVADVVGGQVGAGHTAGVLLEKLGHHQSGEGVGADDGIDAVGAEIGIELPGPLGEELIHRGMGPEHRGVPLRPAVAQAEQPGQVAVDRGMAPGDEGGKAAGDEGQGVLHGAGLAHLVIIFLDGGGAGIVALAGVAAEDKSVHAMASLLPPVLSRRAQSRWSRGRL